MTSSMEKLYILYKLYIKIGRGKYMVKRWFGWFAPQRGENVLEMVKTHLGLTQNAVVDLFKMVEAASNNHVLDTINNVNVPILILFCQVTGVKPIRPLVCLCCFLWFVVIAFHNTMTASDQLPHFLGRQFFVVLV